MDAIQTVIVPVDFSEASSAAAEAGLGLARRLGVPLRVLHAVPPMVVMSPGGIAVPSDTWSSLLDGARQKLAECVEALSGRGVEVASALRETASATAIEDEVAEHPSPLVVMSPHGRGRLERLMLGSVTERTVRRATCPVLVVKGDAGWVANGPETILVATDFSDQAAHAADLARELAVALGARLEVAHAFQGPMESFRAYGVNPAMDFVTKLQREAATAVEQSVARLDQGGVSVQGRVVEGPAASAIAERAAAAHADLIVMGTHGHTGLVHLALGSVAERTLREADVSVLVVPKPR